MAAGLPVLASDLPAHRDTIQHKETGWLMSTPDELVQGLGWLENPENNSQTGLNTRRWVKESFGDWDDCAEHYTAAYRKLL